MVETLQIPVSLIKKMANASMAFQDFEEELEDYLISQDENLLNKLKNARENHLKGNLRPFSEIVNDDI
jgi:hypothetical protein